MNDERLSEIRRLLFNHAKSPSLRHIRDANTIQILASEIMKVVDRRNTIWSKWSEQREGLAKAALLCWIPVDDLRDFLNQLSGPVLTTTDVAQRMRAFEEEDFASYPKEEMQAGCLELYQLEKAQGTELPAVVGLLQEHVEREEERLRIEQNERYVRLREEDRISREQRLLSGADCRWTELAKSTDWHCRKNGRLYRLSPTKDKMWSLSRVTSVDAAPKDSIGTYQHRKDASAVVAKIAYQPELR